MISGNRNFKISDDSQHLNEPNSGRKHRIHAVLGWLCSSHQGLSNKPKIVEIKSQDPKLALRVGTLLCHITRFGVRNELQTRISSERRIEIARNFIDMFTKLRAFE